MMVQVKRIKNFFTGHLVYTYIIHYLTDEIKIVSYKQDLSDEINENTILFLSKITYTWLCIASNINYDKHKTDLLFK